MFDKAKWLLLVSAALALLAPVPAAAKGSFERITVSGPDWFGEIEITDPETLAALDMASFMDMQQPVASPEQLGGGYLLTRGYFSGEGEAQRFTPFDRVMAFPGSPGFVYYIEIVNGSGPMDGRWYRMSDTGQAALLQALQAAGVRLGSSRALNPIPAAAADPTPWLVPALAALVGAAAGWIAGRGPRQALALRPS